MTPAVKLMTSTSMAFRLCEYDHDPANSNFGLEAADLLGLDSDQVSRLLSCLWVKKKCAQSFRSAVSSR